MSNSNPTRHSKGGTKKSDPTRGGLSCEEIGQRTGLSRQRIQQIEKNALAKLRMVLEARGYTQEQVREFFQRSES